MGLGILAVHNRQCVGGAVSSVRETQLVWGDKAAGQSVCGSWRRIDGAMYNLCCDAMSPGFECMVTPTHAQPSSRCAMGALDVQAAGLVCSIGHLVLARSTACGSCVQSNPGKRQAAAEPALPCIIVIFVDAIFQLCTDGARLGMMK